MAKAIFYDRKHNCEVSAKEIVHINFVVTLASTQPDPELRANEKRKVTSAWEMQRGEFGYKSPDCPKGQNWDRWLNYSDLIFLRFE